MDLFSLFEACERTWVGDTIRQSIWLFPAIEAVHLLALGLLGGAVLMLDLRLLGVGLTSPTPSQLERQTRPWAVAAVVAMVFTGSVLFMSEALKLYASTPFRIKMATLLVVLIYTFAVRNPFARRATGVTALSRLVAGVSMLLWLVVAMAGRWIGFS
ncbi:MAG: hypothetical protein H7Y33_10985 [Cytophagales bacterium]|nr:hypothetical protein [Rhizobacter sp.]